MRRERRSPRRALPWIVLALLATAVVLLWRGSRAPEQLALDPQAAGGRDVPVGEDEALPVRPALAPRREATPAPAARSHTGPAARKLTGSTLDEARRPLGGVHVEVRWLLGARDANEASIHHACVSDAAGRFELETFDGASAELLVSAWRDEYDLLLSSPFERDASGEWLPVELVLCPSADLAVKVLGVDGAPIEGLEVLVRGTAAEASTWRAGMAVLLPRHAPAVATTDAEGRAELRVSARRVLEVQLALGRRTLSFDRALDGQLVRESHGAPLLLAPGERRELVARLGRPLVIEGTVARADGAPVDDGRIRLLDGDPALIGFLEAREELRLDEHGRFRFELQDLPPDARLAVLAVDGFWFGMPPTGLRGATFRDVRVDEAVDDVVTLALVVEELESLQGRVLDADGSPLLAGTVWAIPRGAEYLLRKSSHGLLPLTMLDPERPGEFTLNGLLPGEHDLVVKRGEPRTYHRFDGYRAGQRGIELRIEDDREVAIRLTFAGAEGELRFQPVLITHHLRHPSEHARAAAPTRVHVEGCAIPRWPERTGISSLEEPDGRELWSIGEPRVAREHHFGSQQAGWYSVGALAWDASGRPFLRRLSEMVRLERGEHEFVLELVPTTRLTGLAAPGECIEVLDAAGARVPAARDELFAQADGRGAFCFDEVPLGSLRVRVGTRADLERGVARAELPAHAQQGAELVLRFE